MYRRYVLGDTPGPASWTLQDAERPPLGPREVRMRVRACSLNYRDLMVALGTYGGRHRPGLVPLSDGAGEVLEVGTDVSRVTVGDRVAANFFPDWVEGEIAAEKTATALGGGSDGMLSEEVVISERAIVRVPEALSFEEAACLPCAGLTAWNILFNTGRLQPGETVLLQGTGGVSIFALQFAKAAGARVILTSSSDEKLARGREMGADETINYRTEPDWDKAARRLTGSGVDLIVEVGGAGTMAKSLRAARPGGRIVSVGVLSGGQIDFPLGYLFSKNLTLTGVYVGPVVMFEAMNRSVALNGIRPVVDRVLPLEEAQAALEHLQSGSHFGKIVIRL